MSGCFTFHQSITQSEHKHVKTAYRQMKERTKWFILRNAVRAIVVCLRSMVDGAMAMVDGAMAMVDGR